MRHPLIRSHGMAHTDLSDNRVPGISAIPHDDNLRYFDVEIHGPSSSPYEGASYFCWAIRGALNQLAYQTQAASLSSNSSSPTTTRWRRPRSAS